MKYPTFAKPRLASLLLLTLLFAGGSSFANIPQINYTYNNSGSPTTQQVLSGGNNGGEFYWEFGGFSSGSATYSVVANTGDYAEVGLLFTSASSGAVDIHFSMLR